MSEIERIKDMLKKKKKSKKISIKNFLSTGSTLLNLACSGRVNGGFAKGHYYFLVGDSTSGKTFLSLTCLAEASINPNFEDYRFIYDNAEDGALMDIERFFGSGVADTMESPTIGEEGEPVFSTTIEEFYYHFDDIAKEGKPFIYILDSMDSLSSEYEQDKFDATKKAYEKGTQITGSMGDGKAKKNSAGLRRTLKHLSETGSILIIINQTRDNIGFGFEKKTRSGGHAQRFYATIELWSSVIKKIKKKVKGKDRQIGVNCRIKIKKNRITGQEHTVDIPIYHSFGIDDIGSCVDYLIEEGHWKKSKSSIVASDFDFTGTRDKLIQYIEDNTYEKDLRELVGDVWKEIEEACTVKRKFRYE